MLSILLNSVTVGSRAFFLAEHEVCTDAEHSTILSYGSCCSQIEMADEIKCRTNGDSVFVKSFYHTKMGSFAGREGGQVGSLLANL